MSFIIYKRDGLVRKLDSDAVDSDKEGFTTFIRNLKVNIQPASPEYIALTPIGENEKLYQGFTTTTGIKIGMQIVVSGTTTISGMNLMVRGIQEFRGPIGTHYELALTEPK